VAIVTATLNLDTSVVFLTPVLILAARRAGGDEAVAQGWESGGTCSGRTVSASSWERARNER
jgi:hypothetical protein